MGLFNFAAAVTEEIFDEVSGNKKRRRARWMLESKDTAAEVRQELAQDAYKIWLNRNKSKKNELTKELKMRASVSNSLTKIKRSLEGAQAPTESRNHNSQDNPGSTKFEDTLLFSSFSKKVQKEFPFQGAIFYEGEKDDFIKHLDAFMREELKAHPKLLSKWATRVDEAKNIKK